MELTDKQYKKLESISRRMIKANKEIKAMGFDVYLSAHGSANVMCGASHGDNQESLQENVVFQFTLEGWDGGDW